MNQKQIQELKDKYGTIFILPVDDKTAYLKAPKMSDFKRAFTALQNEGEMSFAENLLSALFVAGDKEIIENDDYLFPARKELKSFFVYDDAELIEDSINTIIIIGEEKCTVRKITRADLKMSEKKNPTNKPFVTQEKLFELVCVEKTEGFNDKENADIRMPLYQALEQMQNKKTGSIKKI